MVTLRRSRCRPGACGARLLPAIVGGRSSRSALPVPRPGRSAGRASRAAACPGPRSAGCMLLGAPRPAWSAAARYRTGPAARPARRPHVRGSAGGSGREAAGPGGGRQPDLVHRRRGVGGVAGRTRSPTPTPRRPTSWPSTPACGACSSACPPSRCCCRSASGSTRCDVVADMAEGVDLDGAPAVARGVRGQRRVAGRSAAAPAPLLPGRRLPRAAAAVARSVLRDAAAT